MRLLPVVLCAALCLGTAHAQEKEQKRTPQQERMAACNKEAGAKQMKGEQRKDFMSKCLKEGPPPAQAARPATQQDRMKSCNKQASDKGLKGDERKSFMSGCLKA